MKKRYWKYLFFGIIIATVSTLMLPDKKEDNRFRDYADIADEGILRVTTEYGNNTYRINNEGEIEGFHYQLILKFAQAHGLKLEVIPEMNHEKQNQMLQTGSCDLIASGRILMENNDSTFNFTTPISVDHQVIIQRKAEITDTLCTYLKSQVDLAGKTLTIPQHSPIKQRIKHLMEEIGDSIYIEEIPQYGSEQLMALVAHGDRCYAVCEKDIVKAHIHQYPQLDDKLALGFNQFYAWTVNKHSTALLDSLNTWLTQQGIILRKK